MALERVQGSPLLVETVFLWAAVEGGGMNEPFAGMPVYTSRFIPPGKIFVATDLGVEAIWMHPQWTPWWYARFAARLQLLTSQRIARWRTP